MQERKIVTKNDLMEEILVAERFSSAKIEEKLENVVRNADAEVRKWIIEKNIFTWAELKKEAALWIKEEIRPENIFRIAMKIREPNEDPLNYVKYKMAQMQGLNISENIIIEYLAQTIWSTDKYAKDKLSRSLNIQELLRSVEIIADLKKRKK